MPVAEHGSRAQADAAPASVRRVADLAGLDLASLVDIPAEVFHLSELAFHGGPACGRGLRHFSRARLRDARAAGGALTP